MERAQDTISKNSIMVNHLEPAKKCIIGVMHRYVLLSNGHLEYEKKKWRVLNKFPRYDIATQRSVIFATMDLHNFIRQHNFEDSDFDDIENDGEEAQDIENDERSWDVYANSL